MGPRASFPQLARLVFASCLVGAAVIGVSASAPVGAADEAGVEFYEKKVRPVLVAHCYECHGPDKQEAGLQVDTVGAMLRGGDQGPAVVPGEPETSLLIKGLRYDDIDFQMPPKGKISDEKIAALEQWVKMGAPAPADEKKPAAGSAKKKFDLAERAKHWCFQPLAPSAPPAVRNRAWARTDIDRYILAKLEAAQLAPAAPADKRTLIRRATFDLIGLPPTPAEVAAFLADESPDAFAKVVDRLLASPHFGERWARHWLDLVRYAESRGHEFDYVIPNAFQYRDYVIRALNDDVPYDRFVQEHLAGDLMALPRLNAQTGANESILGTGFWFLGEECHSPVDIRQDETDRIDNKIDVMSKTFLGLTLACARCHDHKFDALSTKDYYALSGFVRGITYRQTPFEAVNHNRALFEQMMELENDWSDRLLDTQLALARPTATQVEKYLLATREVLLERRKAEANKPKQKTPDQTKPEQKKSEQKKPEVKPEPKPGKKPDDQSKEPEQKTEKQTENDKAIAAVAGRFGLEPARLAAWVDDCDAAQDRDHPLHGWRRFVLEGQRPTEAASRLATFSTNGSLADPQRIFRADLLHPHGWESFDGVAFGEHSTRPGQLQFGTDASRPAVRLAERYEVRLDPKWDFHRNADGTERENTRNNWQQSGRTFKTPTVILATGKVWYLVRGSGRVYAAVDSHRINNGPLHGQLIKVFAGPDKPTWIQHDLTRYQGERAHFEFSPLDASELKENQSGALSILSVVDSDTPPTTSDWSWNFEPVKLATDQAPLADDEFAKRFAAAYGAQLRAATDPKEYRRGAGRMHEKDFAAAEAERQAAIAAAKMETACNMQTDGAAQPNLLAWIVANPTMWNTPSAELSARMAPFFDAQGKLFAQVKRTSRTAPTAWQGNEFHEQVLIRGNYRTPGDHVPPRFLSAFNPEATEDSEVSRQMLAHEIVAGQGKDLAARVAVNRLWQHLFGRGIVKTVDNFGIMGETPTHPELLDHLAARMMAEGWSIKKMLRELALTATYQMDSTPDAATAAKIAAADPENKLLHRARPKRLEAEAIRDAILAVSGKLDEKLYGPSVPTFITQFMEGRGRPGSGPLDGAGRRSIYLSVRRNFLNPMFQAFDYPTPFTSVGQRSNSNVPAQALSLMNGEFVRLQAQHWAERAAKSGSSDSTKRIEELYEAAYGRKPTGDEALAALEFLLEQRELYDAKSNDDIRPWTDLCHVLFNVKEFIYLR